MKILVLGPVKQKIFKSFRNEPIIKFLKKDGNSVIHYNQNINLKFIKKNDIQLVIINGYSYKIKSDVINFLNNKVYNLHPAYLPFGKGVGGLLFSLLNNQETGITIHQVDENYDTGKIVSQKKINPRKNDTFREFYLNLLSELNVLFLSEWSNIRDNKFKMVRQKKLLPRDDDFYTKIRTENALSFFDKNYDIKIDKLKQLSFGHQINESFFSMIKPKKNIIANTALIENCRIGNEIVIGNYSIIGTAPNHIDFFSIDKIYSHKYYLTIIEDEVIIRDNCVIHSGVIRSTKIGKNSKIMSGTHIDHDVQIGNSCTIAPRAMLAGNVTVKDFVQIGMGAQIHQNITISEYSMIGMGSTIVKNVPPFSLSVGTPGRVKKLNDIKLKRLKISKKLYQILYDVIILKKYLKKFTVSKKEQKYLDILHTWYNKN